LIKRVKTENEFLYRIKNPTNGQNYKGNIILLGEIFKRMNKRFSNMVVVCGGQRSGKSFFALWLALRILEFYHPEKEFDISKYVFYDPIQSLKQLKDLERDPIIIDEAGSHFNKAEWFSRMTKAMDKIIQTQGYKTNTYIFVAPFVTDIAKVFRRHIDYMVHVQQRGYAVVYKIPKKYNMMADKDPKPYFLEPISLKMSNISNKNWEIYEQFSFQQKEKLRQQLYDRMMEDDTNHTIQRDPFGNPMN